MPATVLFFCTRELLRRDLKITGNHGYGMTAMHKMNNRTFLVKALISVAFFTVLLSFVQGNELVAMLDRIDWLYFTLSFLLVPLMLSTSCLKWKLLLGCAGTENTLSVPDQDLPDRLLLLQPAAVECRRRRGPVLLYRQGNQQPGLFGRLCFRGTVYRDTVFDPAGHPGPSCPAATVQQSLYLRAGGSRFDAARDHSLGLVGQGAAAAAGQDNDRILCLAEGDGGKERDCGPGQGDCVRRGNSIRYCFAN